jgi:hypothetical protein
MPEHVSRSLPIAKQRLSRQLPMRKLSSAQFITIPIDYYPSGTQRNNMGAREETNVCRNRYFSVKAHISTMGTGYTAN